MKIAHIFNEVKKEGNENKSFFNPYEFEKDYIKNFIEKKETKNKDDILEKYYQNRDEKDDFGKKYYGSLIPCKDNIISKYDNKKIDNLVGKLGKNILMISGDFWGIQKFIFDGLTAKKASKILRSRSAMVQLITFAVVDIIKKRFDKSDVVLFGAGKFLILASCEKDYEKQIKKIQTELDEYFLQKFFGLNGFILSVVQTHSQNILKQKSKKLEEDLKKLAKENELNKLQKFNFTELKDDNICIDIFAKNDNEVCKFCGKRTIDESLKRESCDICFNQINLGEKLTQYRYINIIMFNKKAKEKKISHNLIEIFRFDRKIYYARFTNHKNHFSWGETFDISDEGYDKKIPKWSLNSYVAKEEDGKIKDFTELCKFKDKDKDKDGNYQKSSGLMAMKADVDKLGDTFREFYYEDFKKFNRLSRELDFFFSDYATSLMKKKNLYTVFAGGDDLFVIGEYGEIIKYAKDLRDKFYTFSLKKSTLSMGLVMFKPSTPINYISRLADEAEIRAKNVTYKNCDETRDGIDLFGISMKFNEFLQIEKDFKEVIEFLENENDDKTVFYYRLIELCDMRENLKSDEIDYRNAMWKSKLNYLFRRNVKKEDNDSEIFDKLNTLIETYGEKFKPSIFLKIYENKDKR